MKKNIIIYGIIAGIVVSIPMLFMANAINNFNSGFNYDTGMIVGYASMLIAFSLVYVGIRNYKINFNGGIINFGKALKLELVLC
jgi:hypothetical protein